MYIHVHTCNYSPTCICCISNSIVYKKMLHSKTDIPVSYIEELKVEMGVALVIN